jgi:hypothetical protein
MRADLPAKWGFSQKKHPLYSKGFFPYLCTLFKKQTTQLQKVTAYETERFSVVFCHCTHPHFDLGTILYLGGSRL